jgi:gliding motility-associated-like protein
MFTCWMQRRKYINKRLHIFMEVKKVIFTVLLVTLSLFGNTQVIADFTADTTEFCTPYLVTFQDMSQGGPIIYRKWIFTPTNFALGNQTNPSSSFVTPGYYDITLIVSDGTDTSIITKANFIQVFKNPIAKFSTSLPLSGCTPIEVQFTNQSIMGDAPITGFKWTYGDNSPLNLSPNPKHSYQQHGLFTVSLAVTDANGCKASTDSVNLINAIKSPEALFGSTNVPHHCQTPLTVNFVNNSTGVGPLTSSWDFGNAITSNQTNPTTTYNSAGSYDVTLIVIDTAGCTDTLFEPNFASATTTNADFSPQADTVCLGADVLFNNMSVGGNIASWDFGDGSPKASQWDPTHSYNTPGLFSIELIVSASATCIDTITKGIYVQLIDADFTVNNPYGCETPHLALFTNNSMGIGNLSYQWYFGDLYIGQSTVVQPQYFYQDFGYYDVKLIVESSIGCVDSVTVDSAVHVFEIEPLIGTNTTEGCAPVVVNFQDFSSPADSVVHRLWNFGDSTYSVNPNETKTYNIPGTYFVKLSVWTHDSCYFEDQVIIEVGTKQTAGFTLDSIAGCASDTVQFFNLSQDTSLINEYTWFFGDGQTSSNYNPKHLYVDTGWMDMSLIAIYNGCPDTVALPKAYRVLGPTINFNYIVDCSNPYDIQFNSNVIDADSLIWNYGDSTNNDTNLTNPVHTYVNRADYIVSLVAINHANGCTNTAGKFLSIRDLKAEFTLSDTVACAPAKILFNAADSEDERPGNYAWYVNGVSSFSSNTTLNYSLKNKNLYKIELVVSDDNFCKDTATEYLHLFKPEARFSVDTTAGCVPFIPQFTNTSLTDTTVVQYLWNFGNNNLSFLENPTTVYNPSKTKWFDISLIVTNKFGCTDTAFKKSYMQAIRPPFQVITDPTMCVGDTAFFLNYFHLNGHSYQWFFNNNDSSTAIEPTTQFIFPGQYDILCIVTDSVGCQDSVLLNNLVDVQSTPSPLFTAQPTDTSCYPAIVQFNDSTAHPYIKDRYWDFGDGSSIVSTTNNVVFHNYLKPDKYDVSLTIETTYGCIDTLNSLEYINIHGPYANLIVEDDTVCTGNDVFFTLDSASGIWQNIWDFGDGNDTTVFASEDTVYHAYSFSGFLVFRVLMIDSALKCPKYFEDSVFIHETVAEFTADTFQGCSPLLVNLIENSIGADQFNWREGTTFETGDTASFTFINAGQTNLTFYATDSLTGCVDSIIKVFNVFPIPNVHVTDDTVICVGDSITLEADGGVNFSWLPNYGIENNRLDSIRVSPDTGITYTVAVTNSTLCKNTSTIKVGVQKPFKYIAADDTSVFAGQSATLWYLSNDTLLSTWTPTLDIFCPNCSSSEVTPKETTKYNLVLRDYYGCYELDTFLTIRIEDNSYLFVPDAFTPNGDGINDLFRIGYDGYEKLVYFKIIDRYGHIIYETNDEYVPWDGIHKGNPIEHTQVFIYHAVFKRYNGKTEETIGTVTLLK